MTAARRPADRPSDRPTEPMDDDDEDGAPTELWSHPSDTEIRVMGQWRSAIAPAVPARPVDQPMPGASLAPLAIEETPRTATKREPSRAGSRRTLALGTAIIGAAACVGLGLGHLARNASLGEPAGFATRPAATQEAPLAQHEAAVAQPPAIAPAIAVDALPSLPSVETVVEKTPTVRAPLPAAELDRAAATASIARAAAAAAACDGAEGALVQVTFAPTGRVSAVTGSAISGASRACVAAAFRGVAVAPFRGPAVSVPAAIAR